MEGVPGGTQVPDTARTLTVDGRGPRKDTDKDESGPWRDIGP